MLTSKDNKYNWIWPKIVDIETAKKAALQGFYASIFIGGSTLLLLGLSYQGFNPLNLDAYSVIDVLIFAIIAWRVQAMSQTAAIIGLAVYILEQIYLVNEFGFSMNAMRIIIIFAFVNSIRGTYAFNVFRKYSNQQVE